MTGPARAIDLSVPRRFFMGVMGWTPETVMHEASLEDLLDCWRGYAQARGILPVSPPSRRFMDEMLRKFPD